MLKNISLLCLRHRDKRFIRMALAAFFAFFRGLFAMLPLKLSFFLIVLIRCFNVRAASFLASDFREVILKNTSMPHDFQFSSILTVKLPLETIAILVRLSAFEEAKILLAKRISTLSSNEKLLWVALDYFDLGEFERAQQVIDLCSADIKNSPALMHFKGLKALWDGVEDGASFYLLKAANHLSAGWCPHQNIAARYPNEYPPLLTDLNAGVIGLFFDAYHFLGQRVTSLGWGDSGVRLYDKAMEMQRCLRQVPPDLSAELKLWLEKEKIDFAELRILPWEWVTQIGHMGMLEILFRMRTLGWWSGQAVILAPLEKSANKALLKLFASQARIVEPGVNTTEAVAKELFSLQRYAGMNFNAWKFPNGEVVPWQQAGARLLRQWEVEQRAYPLREAFDAQYSDSALLAEVARIKADWGMKPDDWYVCLHVRDAGFYTEFQGFGQTHRNGELEAYRDAIDYLTKQGGWVIKMGGANSSPMPPLPRVVDYARLKVKSEFLDLHLIRHASFFIGTTSGLTNIAISFNVPCALVNCITTDAQLWSSQVRFILKPVISATGEPLNQREITSAPWRWRVFNAEVLRRYNAQVINNTPDEILETVKEVHHLARGEAQTDHSHCSQAVSLLSHWQASLAFPEFYGAALPSLYFLQKHEQTLLVRCHPSLRSG